MVGGLRRVVTAALLVGARGAVAAPASVERDDDRLVDVDPTVTCRAEHAAPPADARRCPRWTRVTATAIELTAQLRFDYDKASLRPESLAPLAELAAVLLARPTLEIEIAGHYHDEPHRARKLSQARAAAVASYLISRGVDPARLRAVGYGETRPRVMPVEDRRNWRIEIAIVTPR